MAPREENIAVSGRDIRSQGGDISASSALRKYPADRDIVLKSAKTWLAGKRKDDNLGGLWRIHDKLYDLSTFVDKHPGGRMWIEETRGTDITEAFESSHIFEAAEKILPKYYVRDAEGLRSSVYTFHENGFYKTLRRRVRPILKKAGRGPSWATYVIQDGLALSFAICALLAAIYNSYVFAALAGFVLANNIMAAHNFFHQRDNWHMYLFDLGLLSSHEWRVTHGMSHHLHTNTFYDIEITAVEPFYSFLPRTTKSWVVRYGSVAYGGVFESILFILEAVKRTGLVITGYEQLRPENLLPLGELLIMWALQTSFLQALWLWVIMHSCCSFWFACIGLAVAHHHPDIYHEGDKFRSDDPDWGLCELDAVRDRALVTGKLPLVLISFGDHALHHLFPTVDHSKLYHLYPELLRTCKEFGYNFELVSEIELFLGKYKQLMNVSPNQSYPGGRKQKRQ